MRANQYQTYLNFIFLLVILLLTSCINSSSDQEAPADPEPEPELNANTTVALDENPTSFFGVEIGKPLKNDGSFELFSDEREKLDIDYFNNKVKKFRGDIDRATNNVVLISYDCYFKSSDGPISLAGYKCGDAILPKDNDGLKQYCNYYSGTGNQPGKDILLKKGNAYFIVKTDGVIRVMGLMADNYTPENFNLNSKAEEICANTEFGRMRRVVPITNHTDAVVNSEALKFQELFGLGAKAIEPMPIPDIQSTACQNYTPKCSSDPISFNSCRMNINSFKEFVNIIDMPQSQSGLNQQQFGQQQTNLLNAMQDTETEPSTGDFMASIDVAYLADKQGAKSYVDSGLAFADCFMLRTGNSSKTESYMQTYLKSQNR